MSNFNWISININIMDMKKHMLICLFIFVLGDKKSGEIDIRIWYSYKKSIEIIIRIGDSC
jgi:hypothetical protein